MSRNAPARRITRLLRKNPLVPWWRTHSGRPAEFQFEGKHYVYFFHRRNYTWTNERAVELPLAWEVLQHHTGTRVLEVGNVLSQYFPTSHDVVDKYEVAPGVINQDIVEYRIEQSYDVILSVSTIEHVGWDENPREPDKPLRALRHLMGLLRPGGTLFVTLPLGYNPHLDQFLRDGRLAFLAQRYLKRTSGNNHWVQAEWKDVCDAEYNAPFDGANAIAVCHYRKAA